MRDLYTRDIEEVLVEGEEGYKHRQGLDAHADAEPRPAGASRIATRSPLFHRYQVESQLDAMHSPVVQLRSGGSIVINPTEALAAIDVNSGRSTRERNIEETALETNLEAADEIARQLRLRDLAGLIVIDFIDMEEHRNQLAVERRLQGRAEDRPGAHPDRPDQPVRPAGAVAPAAAAELAEVSTQPCPHCAGTGVIRSVESTALQVLRAIEEEGIRRRSAEICVYVPTDRRALHPEPEARLAEPDRGALRACGSWSRATIC